MTNPFLSGTKTCKVVSSKLLANLKALLIQVSETKLFGIEPAHILRALKLGFFGKLEMLQDRQLTFQSVVFKTTANG